ncbi:MAG: hypothetical protein K9I99_15095 [Melioribacteraceae bacterium]|nr:hypothetical protein [Melioribacteraceae bacterium]MCF8414551.1 hypothetical protein [Melioribacteraceae bacterium]
MPIKPERLEAKKYYVEHLFSIQTIQKVLSAKVSRKTLYNWKNNSDGLDEADWDTLKTQRFTEAKEIKEELREITKSLIAELKADPKNPMLWFALSKHMTSLKFYDEFEGLFKEINKENEDESKKTITPETVEKVHQLLTGG